MANKVTRKNSAPIKVYSLSEEKDQIKNQAQNCGISVSKYLRTLGMGYKPKSIVDNEKVQELAKINGDLGRLGGLLKLWLSNDRRAAHFDKKNH
jgi:hypothetical protein